MHIQMIKDVLKDLTDLITKRLGNGHEKECRDWLKAATLKIWAANGDCAESYADALSVFEGEHYTTLQILTAMDCVRGSRSIKIPDFFVALVSADLAEGSNHSRQISDVLCNFLSVMAMVNSDFTLEEAEVLRKISNLLQGYCSSAGVLPGKEPEIRPQMITERSSTGYYADGNLPEEKSAKPNVSPEMPKPVINFNIVVPPNLQVDENNDGHAEFEAPKAGVNVTKPDENKETIESVLAELNGLIGLEKVKEDVQSLMNFVRICQIRAQRGMKVPTVSYHLVFTGNPGTGKTTVARLVAKLYHYMGLLAEGQLVETDRSGMVAGYVGQTAIKTQKVIQKALGGVLFIDEAYALANEEGGDSFGKEAIETLLKAMEDYRDDLVVIVAGYEELMRDFINSNPGLRSRFNKYIRFDDYNGQELMAILNRFCSINGYSVAEDAAPFLKVKLDAMYARRRENFGNARTIRNLFEHAINHQANRLAQDNDLTNEELAELTLADFEKAMEEIK